MASIEGKKKTGYRKYITKHYKAIVSVHLEKLKNKMHVSSLQKHRYMPIIITDDISIDQASTNPDRKH